MFHQKFAVQRGGIRNGHGNLQPGSAAVATFNEIKVNSITIFVQKSDLYNDQGELKISEIVVLGK